MKLRSAPRLANRAPKYPPRPPDPMTATRMPPSVRAAAAPVKSTGSPPAATETTGAAVHTPQRTLRPPTTFVAVRAPSRKGGKPGEALRVTSKLESRAHGHPPRSPVSRSLRVSCRLRHPPSLSPQARISACCRSASDGRQTSGRRRARRRFWRMEAAVRVGRIRCPLRRCCGHVARWREVAARRGMRPRDPRRPRDPLWREAASKPA